MKYYVYISDTKLGMLYPQLPYKPSKKIAAEFGLDFKIVKAMRRSEMATEDNRIKRLEDVVSALRKSCQVGTVDEPSEYIHDVLPMKFLTLRGGEMFFFTGQTAKSVIGLAGSSGHMLGEEREASHPLFHSILYRILNALDEIGGHLTNYSEKEGLRNVKMLAERIEGDPEFLEFFAKRLAWDPDFHGTGERVILASPLYIAKAD